MTEREREAARILAENARRLAEIPAGRYAPWQPAELFLRQDRTRSALRLLKDVNRLPTSGARALEVGCGTGGWLPELLAWGLETPDLAGIDLDTNRVEVARKRFPSADLRVGDAAALPWPSDHFDLVVVSTVFSSILDGGIQTRVAAEIERVLNPGGALLWYDLALDNPRNRNVRGIGRSALRALFPQLIGQVRRCGLLPPLARWLAARSHTLATLAATLPPLRSHLLAVLHRP
jgi:ubiquinone/menaquinone biosynthesis C-methylase UbiE